MGTVTSVSGGTMSVTATGGMMNISATLVGKPIMQFNITNRLVFYYFMTHALHSINIY